MSPHWNEHEVLNVNCGGKRFNVCRDILTAASESKLAKWFKIGTKIQLPIDSRGYYFLNRDGKAFREILSYLRHKKQKSLQYFALPSEPSHLFLLIAECDALILRELKHMVLELLYSYHITPDKQFQLCYAMKLTIVDTENDVNKKIMNNDNSEGENQMSHSIEECPDSESATNIGGNEDHDRDWPL
ncbi:unnamed protein product [Thelazia callipaeda]|uniref:BTB_2 domain-containing protein n=1 Tax=Thelazia callipaeda TaxID=103827 RepID=A0A0N5CVJ5_THECL|nr:unnamed protein product [Thelazia callipaeda]